MGLIAFFQLMSVGMAVVLRKNDPAPVEVVTVVETKYVTIEKETPVVPRIESRITQAEIDYLVNGMEIDTGIEAEVLQTAPTILDPVVERLVGEARVARVAGDIMKSTMKLEEAQVLEPQNPNVLYELALNFEELLVFDNASDYYKKVYDLGPLKAGSLFKKSALKLAQGVVADTKGLAVLNAARKLEPQMTGEGERRSVNLAITTSPGREFDPDLIHVQVHFFEESFGELRPAPINTADPEATGSQCVSMPYDWADSEEMIEVWYCIPHRDSGDRLLDGDRKFHGFVAKLYYDNKLLDIRAQPRTLVDEIRSQRAASKNPYDSELDSFLEELDDYSAGDSLLPRLGR